MFRWSRSNPRSKQKNSTSAEVSTDAVVEAPSVAADAAETVVTGRTAADAESSDLMFEAILALLDLSLAEFELTCSRIEESVAASKEFCAQFEVEADGSPAARPFAIAPRSVRLALVS